MRVTTSRAFRQKHLNHYHYADFECFEDYFLYLHLNRNVQWVHVLGGIVPLPLLPWCIGQLFLGQLWPFLAFSAVFYGAGFLSHWSSDGLVSQTVKNFGPAYKEVIMLNFRVLFGQIGRYETAFAKKYPHVMWVYLKDAVRPES